MPISVLSVPVLNYNRLSILYFYFRINFETCDQLCKVFLCDSSVHPLYATLCCCLVRNVHPTCAVEDEAQYNPNITKPVYLWRLLSNFFVSDNIFQCHVDHGTCAQYYEILFIRFNHWSYMLCMYAVIIEIIM